MLDVYGAREAPIEGVSGRLVLERLAAIPGDRTVAYLSDRGSAAARIAAQLRPRDVLFTVGAGDITKVSSEVLELLRGSRA